MAVSQPYEPFRPGDTVILPFLIVAARAIVNISDGIVTATLSGRGTAVEMMAGSGITLEETAPPPAMNPADQVAHGIVTLGPEITSALPLGALTKLTLSYVTSAGVRMHTDTIILAGVDA